MKPDSGCLGWVSLCLLATVAAFFLGLMGLGCPDDGSDCDLPFLNGFLFAFIGFFACWMGFLAWRFWQLRRKGTDTSATSAE